MDPVPLIIIVSSGMLFCVYVPVIFSEVHNKESESQNFQKQDPILV